MKLHALLLLCISGAASAADSKDHPVVKVIDLLKSLKEKAISEGKEEAVAYTKFTYWCSTNTATLKAAISEEKATIDELGTKIEGLTKEKASLEEQIKTLEDQIAALEASGKAAKEDRDDAHKLYTEADADLASTISAIDECIKALEEAESTTEAETAAGGGELNMLAQKSVKKLLAIKGLAMTKNERHDLEAYVAGGVKEEPAHPTLKAEGDMEAHKDKYNFKSENVIELLKGLKLKFKDDQLAGTKAETNAVNAYELSKQARDNSIQAAKDSKDKKETELASTESAIAEAENSLKNTKDDLAADSQSLADVEESCATKQSEWEARSKTRTEEIAAMDAAIKILSKSTGVRSEAPENPIPPASPVSFLQLLASPSDPKMKAITLLREAAKSAHSKALERLAVEVQAHLSGPFDDINNMIEKMIFRLMDEQKKEDEHKAWCDKEISKTETMKEDKEDKIADLKAEIENLDAKVAQLASDIEEDNTMISEIDTFMKEATEIREIGKNENALAVKDSKDAQASLANAIAVLTTFYKESGEIAKEPWEFIQEPVKLPENPNTWDSPYTGVADPKKQPGGIIAVLETVLSDYEKMEAETQSQETVDQKEYEESMKSSKIEKARRTQEVEMKSAERSRKVDKIASLSSQKKQTEAGLEKTETYLEDLKPACVDGDSTYEDRKAARSEEVKALQEAQIILLEAFKEKAAPALVAKGKATSQAFLKISRHGALP